MGFIHVTDRAGKRHELEAVEGWRVMEILRDHGVGMEGICGGACACATCHVVIDETWADRLHPPRDEEIDKLDELPLLHDGSRLSCQIIWGPDLDGLSLTIADD
ncbi:MAG: 2Fe-2S iron-sulfur cluster binding domain-containing protein [Hyphomicrobiaceae bacterium]|nr:2Fe-2S iron-sulfur cluster binding domain-containing protein [Hyphomicrobiaceae bacterium]